MSVEYSQSVKMSSAHDLAIDYDDAAPHHADMVDNAQIIAGRLKLLREALDLNQAELCRRTGLAPNRWNQYETGERPITVAAAAILCEAFGVTLDWIYRGDRSGLPDRILTKIPLRAA